MAAGLTSLPPASDMLELVWDSELARAAQTHADQCRQADWSTTTLLNEKDTAQGTQSRLLGSVSLWHKRAPIIDAYAMKTHRKTIKAINRRLWVP